MFFVLTTKNLKLLWFFALSIVCSSLLASTQCPRGEDANWTEECFETRSDGNVHVREYFKANLTPDRFGVTLIRRGNTLSLVDKLGVVRINGVVFDPVSLFNNGLGRYHTNDGNKKCGYFNKNLTITIPAQYDGCGRFKNNVAFVCSGCTEYCTDSDCHDHVFIDGNGFLIDKKGSILKKITNKTLDTICNPPSVLVNKINEHPPYIRCDP